MLKGHYNLHAAFSNEAMLDTEKAEACCVSLEEEEIRKEGRKDHVTTSQTQRGWVYMQDKVPLYTQSTNETPSYLWNTLSCPLLDPLHQSSCCHLSPPPPPPGLRHNWQTDRQTACRGGNWEKGTLSIITPAFPTQANGFFLAQLLGYRNPALSHLSPELLKTRWTCKLNKVKWVP